MSNSKRAFRGPIRHVAEALTLLLILVPITGFASDPLEYVGFDEASYSAEAQEGLKEIYSGRTFHSGIPLSLIQGLADAEAESQRDVDLGYDPDSPEGEFYSKGRIPSPPNRETLPGVGLGQSVFERDGAMLANGNCLSCHAGVVNGQIVAGLGNNAIMPQDEPSNSAATRSTMFQLAAALSDAERKELIKAQGSRKASATTTPKAKSRGDHFGPFAVWALGARLADPAHTGLVVSQKRTELVELLESTVVPPVDPMPWWLMKYKKRDYWYSDGGPHDAAHFSLNFTTAHPEANENHAAHVESTAKALAFARETQSPVFPGALDADLVQRGADLFHGRAEPADPSAFKACFECHGAYSKKASQPDFGMPGSWTVTYDGSGELKKVKTDGTYNETLQAFRPIADHINKLADYYFAQESPELAPQETYPKGRGYVSPPLVGVWATAPYFHNGSVPTIEAVLNSELRPEIWSRESDPHAYDLEHVGMKYASLSRPDFDISAENAATALSNSKTSIDHMFIYDTKGFGHGNMGHTYGDSLTEDERFAIIEFLKSLSGPDM